MPVILSDAEWARITSLLLAITNAFSVQAKGASLAAGATGDLTELVAKVNERVKADVEPKPNRAQRRAKR